MANLDMQDKLAAATEELNEDKMNTSQDESTRASQRFASQMLEEFASPNSVRQVIAALEHIYAEFESVVNLDRERASEQREVNDSFITDDMRTILAEVAGGSPADQMEAIG